MWDIILEETHEIHKYRRDYGVDLGDWLLSKVGISTPSRPWHNRNYHHPFHITILVTMLVKQQRYYRKLKVKMYFLKLIQNLSHYLLLHNNSRCPNLLQLHLHQVIGVITNFIISLHSVAYNEFLPIFLASRFQPKSLKFPFQIVGGMELDTNYIGTLFSSTGIMGMLIVLVLFPLIDSN